MAAVPYELAIPDIAQNWWIFWLRLSFTSQVGRCCL